jgi:hypothetical protein
MFKQGIDVKEFSESLVKKVMYSSEITSTDTKVFVSLDSKEVKENE